MLHVPQPPDRPPPQLPIFEEAVEDNFEAAVTVESHPWQHVESRPWQPQDTIKSCKSLVNPKFNDSTCARIAQHKAFENTTMLVIVLNAIWIGVDTEWNHVSKKKNGKLPLEPWSIIVENLFCAYFTIEICIRFIAFRVKRNCYRDAWFVFDSVLVTFMIFETWITPIIGLLAGGGNSGTPLSSLSPFRLLRLLRLTRMARLMRFVPELMTLVTGIVAAARSVAFIFAFLLLVLYVFAILFTSQLDDRKKYPLTPYCSWETAHGIPNSNNCLQDGQFGDLAQDYFASMGDSMLTLLTRGILGDNLAETVQAILDQSVFLVWAWWLFFVITSSILLNMLIGVLCEVTRSAAAEEEEARAHEAFKGMMEDAFGEVDSNADGEVTFSEWQAISQNARVRHSMVRMFEEDDIEPRLAQLGELFFKHHISHEVTELTPRPSAAPTVNASPRPSAARSQNYHRNEYGLSLEQVIDQVCAMRPNQYASALDFELLHQSCMNDQDFTRHKLHGIEVGLRRILGQAAAQRCPYKTLVKTHAESIARSDSTDDIHQ